MDRAMIDSLAGLIEYLSVPAFIFSDKKGKVLKVNSRFERKYKELIFEGRSIRFDCLPALRSAVSFVEYFFRGDTVLIRPCTKESSVFSVSYISEEVIIVSEVYKENTATQSFRRPVTQTSDGFRHFDFTPFHFNYIHDFAFNNWLVSDPEKLIERGILSCREDVNNLIWRNMICEEDRPYYDCAVKDIALSGGNHEIHYRIVRKDGELVEVCDYCGIARPENSWPVIIGSVVSAERAISEAQKSQRLLMTGRLIGGMVHDFKNLLGGIHNVIEWVSTVSEKPEVTDALKRTLEYTNQAHSLISSTLKIGVEDNTEKENESFNLGSLISSFENLIAKIVPESIHVDVEVSDGNSLVFGNKNTMQDMLLNLCLNARDAMKDTGSCLQINTRLEHDYENGREYVLLRVVDDGCGMESDECNQVFKPFYSTKSDGAGLGLWMVKKAVKSFNGEINIFSSKGVGTTFEMKFPVHEFATAEQQAKEEEEENSELLFNSLKKAMMNNPKKILYVEDNYLVRTSVENWLESLCFEVISAGDGDSGWGEFLNNKDDIDLIIQDFILPGKSGEELFDGFKSVAPHIPVIISSANPDREKLEAMRSKGAHNLLGKPFKFDDLTKMLSEVFISSEENIV